MEGNPRRVLVFWAGVEGFEEEWIMARPGEGMGEDEGDRGRSLYILITISLCVIMTAGNDGHAAPDAFHQPVIPTVSRGAREP